MEKCAIINQLMIRHVPSLHFHLDDMGIDVLMHAMELIMGLFGSMIPFEHLTTFYDYFFQYKWIYAYKFLITFYKKVEPILIRNHEMMEVLTFLKTFSFKSKKSD